MTKQIDPVQGLVDYVLEIKPFHTKVIEVLVEYINRDCVDVIVRDDIDFCTGLAFPSFGQNRAFAVTASFAYSYLTDPDDSILFDQHGNLLTPIANTFVVDVGPGTEIFIPPKRIHVKHSGANDGTYRITNSTEINGKLYLTVHEKIAESSTFTGSIYTFDPTVMEYCPNGMTWDGVVYGDWYTPHDRTQINVHVDEVLRISSVLAFDDTVLAYNLENTDNVTFDGQPYNLLVAPDKVTLSTAAYTYNGEEYFTLPLSVPNNDSAFLAVTKNGYPVGVELITPTTFRVTTPLLDLGDMIFVQVFAPVTSASQVAVAGYNTTANAVFHSATYTKVEGGLLKLMGGNYTHHFLHNTQIRGYDAVGIVGAGIVPQPAVISFSANSFTIAGEHDDVFATGRRFVVVRADASRSWYDVLVASTDGTTTTITTTTPVDLLVGQYRSIPLVSFTSELWADTIEPVTIVKPAVVFPDTPSPNETFVVTYTTTGPLRIDTGMSIGDDTNVNANGNLVVENELIVTGASSIPIINVIAGEYKIVVVGDRTITGTIDPRTALLVVGMEITITGSAENNGTYLVTNVVYDSNTDTTIVTLGGSPALSTTVPFGAITDMTHKAGTRARTEIRDSISFGWGDITQWFQYTIVGTDALSGMITVAEDAVADIQPGQEIRIIGSMSNDGIYTVLSVAFDGEVTIIVVDGILEATEISGVVEPVDPLPIGIRFRDTIGIIADEHVLAATLTTGGSFVGASDYVGTDIGGYDESLETIAVLYSSTS